MNNKLRPTVPKWCDVGWRSLMERCWAAEPADRPNFSEVAASLRAMEASLSLNPKGLTFKQWKLFTCLSVYKYLYLVSYQTIYMLECVKVYLSSFLPIYWLWKELNSSVLCNFRNDFSLMICIMVLKPMELVWHTCLSKV